MSNEQRAHDLTIACILKSKEIEPNDIYSEYKRIYNLAIQSINRDFPEN